MTQTEEASYNKMSEILPQPCKYCEKIIHPSDIYGFYRTNTQRVYYHKWCYHKAEQIEEEDYEPD